MTELLRHPDDCTVSVVIKTLNEERNIARAIESALAALAPVGGEVIVADSHSTDRTLEIARQHPVRIARLADPTERCCGIGPQLGYQWARGRYIYILDGDMRMHAGFLAEAVAFLAANPRAAGVGGQVVEQNTTSLEFRARVERGTAHMRPGRVDRLDMGGLYRRSAVDAIGYFSDRNLHSYEELDLALRLTMAGWELHRIAAPAVDHFGHDMPAWRLLRKRWTSHYADGIGELVRTARNREHLLAIWRTAREAHIYLGFVLWVAAVLGCSAVLLLVRPTAGLAALALLAVPWLAMSLRKRSLVKASYSLVSWVVMGAAMVRGVLRRRTDPRAPIAAQFFDGSPRLSDHPASAAST